MQSLVPREFVAFDIETTGLDCRKSDIIEIGAVLFRDGAPAEELCTFVRTDLPIPPFVRALTGITPADVESGLSITETLDRFSCFIGNRPLVAHNAHFDVTFVQTKRKANRLDPLANPVYDTLLFARLGLPGQENYKLETLVKSFNLCDGRSHRARSDALACGRIFILALEGVRDLPERKRAALGRLLKTQESETAALLKQAVPETPPSPRKKNRSPLPEPLVPAEKPSEVDGETLVRYFGEGGVLAERLPGYEERPGQLEMAQAALRAFNQNEFLMVEAGTGTGKSLAYLAAAALYASKNNARIVVSTRTKALQDQLDKKEVPFLKETLGVDFRSTLLKGRANYLCLRKWEEMLSVPRLMLRGWEADELLPLVPWAEETESGDVAECKGFNEKENRILWARIASDAETCLGSRCDRFGDCFLMRRRREALASHLVLVNHSLFFTDLKGEGAVLGDYSRIIFDEAHGLEEAGRRHMGLEIAHIHFSTALQKICKDEEGGRGLLKVVRNRLASIKSEKASALALRADDLCVETSRAELRSVRFFRTLGSLVKKQERKDRFRFKEPLVNLLGGLEPSPDLEGYVARLRALIDSAREIETGPEGMTDLLFDLSAAVREVEGLLRGVRELLDASDPSRVYWVECPQNPLNARLFGVPLEIGDIMASRFFDRADAAVFTSATLAVKGSLDYFAERAGVTLRHSGRAVPLIIPSPYDFKKQLFFAALGEGPAPDSPAYAAAAAALIADLSRELTRRTLVLFTSREMLRAVYEAARPAYAEAGLPLLAQDITGNGYALIEEMRRSPGAVLLGTDSFWEGVDLPGEHLEIVVMARLPFGVPTDPLTEARGEACEARAENAFGAFYLPEAVIRFRQGAGRLIRRKDDRGVLLVLDSRIHGKSYGRVFAGSIASPSRLFKDPVSLLAEVKAWFGR